MYDTLDLVEGLLQLDPVRTYPQRGATIVAKLGRASSYALELEGRDDTFASDPPPPAGEPALSIPLRAGRQVLGTLHLYLEGDDRLPPHELRLARWGGRVLARGMAYARRLAAEGRRRSGEDVHDALARAPLTPRERDVVGLLVSGASTRDIAKRTGLTVATVNTYLKRIFSKLGVHSRVELVARMAGTDTSSTDDEWGPDTTEEVETAPTPSPGTPQLTN